MAEKVLAPCLSHHAAFPKETVRAALELPWELARWLPAEVLPRWLEGLVQAMLSPGLGPPTLEDNSREAFPCFSTRRDVHIASLGMEREAA